MTPKDEPELYFDGSNWEDLLRIVTASHMARLYAPGDFTNSDDAYQPSFQVGWVAQRFKGPALDWVGREFAVNSRLFSHDFDEFIESVRNQFGISDLQLSAHRRTQLDNLKWAADLPVFFAEYDRLTALLGITGDSTKITILREKLPHKVKTLIAEQALDFANYDTMRERLLTMWALDPGERVVGVAGPPTSHQPTPKKKKGKKGKGGIKSEPKN